VIVRRYVGRMCGFEADDARFELQLISVYEGQKVRVTDEIDTPPAKPPIKG
jgi:hypothetical protein